MGMKNILSFTFFAILSLICINEKISAYAVQPIISAVKTADSRDSALEMVELSTVGTVVNTDGQAVSGLGDKKRLKSFGSERSSFELPIHYNFEVDDLMPHSLPVPSLGSIYWDRKRRSTNSQQRRNTVQHLQQIVNQQNARQCLQKVICELSADSNVHGREGVRFGRNLLLLEGSADGRTARFYRQAANTGNTIKNAKLCANYYPNCALPSPSLITMANQLMG